MAELLEGLQDKNGHAIGASKTSDQNQEKPVTPETKVRTKADQFQEALSTAAANKREILFTTSKETGTRYHVRLLQVMQTEKERHVEFWKQLQTGAHSPNKVRCIDVKILSSCLDAKLTVCH
ncbi:uncharacterized protein LOC122669824 [Telopea speciosissima]|uniref:uncharacterized protein LOC122669824 n=1 Tax=Telopea speciosissima TaxID=54955 RepID=UPI001CC5EE88|nr:uncharacterized protein LOC122669824 [Telopea speciosissima]